MPLIITISLVFLATFCLVFGIVRLLIGDQLVLKDRFRQIEIIMTQKNKIEFNEDLEKDFSIRILNPMKSRFSTIIQKYTPVKQISTIERKLDYAGRPYNWNASDYLTYQYVTTIAIGIFAFVITWLSGASVSNRIMALLLGFIGGYIFFEMIMENRIRTRKKEIEKALPDVLDLMTVSIEAGLGFDAAMQRVVEKAKGPIAEEFNETLQEMRMGKTRREALQDLGVRTGVADLSRFVESLVQADQLGVSLGNVLRNQSDQMRILRRQRVQEQAMKAPIKMLFPMVLFIFPCMFIIILAPALIDLMGAF